MIFIDSSSFVLLEFEVVDILNVFIFLLFKLLLLLLDLTDFKIKLFEILLPFF